MCIHYLFRPEAADSTKQTHHPSTLSSEQVPLPALAWEQASPPALSREQALLTGLSKETDVAGSSQAPAVDNPNVYGTQPRQ